MKHNEFKKNSFFYEHSHCPDDSGFHNPVHYHPLYEIYLILEGTCDYFIDDRSYHLESGDLAVIPNGIIHNTAYHNTGHSRLLINCDRRYIPASAQPRFYLYRNPTIKDQIEELIWKIGEEYERADSYSDEAILCHMKLLFFLISRHPNTYAEQGSGAVTKAVTFLQAHFSEELSLSQLAELVAISPAHLSRLFKKEVGLGFSEYLSLLRLQHAEQLLRQSGGESIAEIARRCGFPDSNYFSVKFKKLYGVSPKKFKK